MPTTDIDRGGELLVGEVERDPRFARVAHLLVRHQGRTVVDLHRRGPRLLDLFSVTKTVVALLLGIAVEERLLGRDDPVSRYLPEPSPGPEGVTVDHLATLTRGARSDGPWELDEVAVGGRPWVEAFASAEQVTSPGTRFAYDNGASHLLAAVLDRVTGGLAGFAADRLFASLGVEDWVWDTDPQGVPVGPAHLRLAAADLAGIGQLVCHRGRVRGRVVVPDAWVTAMRTPTSPGGPPEHRAYGRGLWIEDERTCFGAGWAGQLLLMRPEDGLVVVAQSETGFDYGPPATDEMPPDWASPLELVRRFLF